MFDAVKIRAQIERAARETMVLSPEVAWEVAFHMTDWLDDLHRYAAFCENPDGFDPEAVDEMLLAFLSHVPKPSCGCRQAIRRLPGI